MLSLSSLRSIRPSWEEGYRWRAACSVHRLKMLLADDFDRHVQDLSDLLDGACPAALRCSEVMCGAALAPAVVPFACAYGEARAEGGVTVLQSGAILDDAFTYDELEMSVSILRDGQVGDRAWLRIEAR